MQIIQPKRSKYKKCTKYYVQDNLLDIIDIEETLLKNRYITKVPKTDFIYAKFLSKYESLKQLNQSKPIVIKSLPKDKSLPAKEGKISSNKNKMNNNNNCELLYNYDNINYELLNKNKFDVNFRRLKLEYKNGYRVLFTKEYYPIEIIGAGAFGLVVNVIQIKTGKKMAVKIINKKNVNENSNAGLLNNEVNILKSLDNPRIMKIYDILDNHHYFFIFMELIEGGNLKDLIIKRYMDNNVYLFRDSECSQIMKGIFEALNYLHKKNIIHRDIKPENILFKTKDDLSSVILCDFGLAYQMDGYENSISGICGTTIYMAPEILLNNNYDYLVDSFSAGIVLYILCSGGKHPFYTKGLPQKEYTEKLVKQKCLCSFSNEMPLLARNLFLKLCKFEPIFRYEVYKALEHPWITRSTKSQIPMTLLEEYNKSDKIKTFHTLLSAIFSLSILKKYLGVKKKKEEVSKNNSYFENLERTSFKTNYLNKLINLNEQDKHMLLTNIKRNSKILFREENDEKRDSSKKIGVVNDILFNLKTTKNLNKKVDSPNSSKVNGFIKTGTNYNKSSIIINSISKTHSKIQGRHILRASSLKEVEEMKEKEKEREREKTKDKKEKKISKLKSHSKYKQMKSSSGHIIINNICKKNEKDKKDNNTIQYSTSRKNSSNTTKMNINKDLKEMQYSSSRTSSKDNIQTNFNQSKYSTIQQNKIFLKKHIVIESKNKNSINDNIKNNNSSINTSHTKKKIDSNIGKYLINYNDGHKNVNIFNFSNKINLQLKENDNNLKDCNQISNYQSIFNSKSKYLLLREIFNNNDF